LLVLTGLFIAVPALAQGEPPLSGTDAALASPPDNAPDEAAPQADAAETPPLPANFSLGDALTFDPSPLTAAPAKPLKLPNLYGKTDLDISRADKADGSSTVTLKQPLPVDWETKVGADIAGTAPSTLLPGQTLPGSVDNRNSGAAWASVGMPNLASIDARLDPNNSQSMVATTLKHGVPVGSRFSVTLQETLSVTDSFNSRNTGDNGLPRPAALPPTTAPSSQFWGSENRLKFDILPSGTSLAAGVVTSSIDPVVHNSFSADQKLYGPLHVTTAVNDVRQPTANKSITAGFKVNW
jgi:hypothetical protein